MPLFPDRQTDQTQRETGESLFRTTATPGMPSVLSLPLLPQGQTEQVIDETTSSWSRDASAYSSGNAYGESGSGHSHTRTQRDTDVHFDLDLATRTLTGSGTQTVTADSDGETTRDRHWVGSDSHDHSTWDDHAHTVTELHPDASTLVTEHTRHVHQVSDVSSHGGSDSSISHTDFVRDEQLSADGTRIETTGSNHSSGSYTEYGVPHSSDSTEPFSYSTPVYEVVGGWSPPSFGDLMQSVAAATVSKLEGAAFTLTAAVGEFMNLDLNFADPYYEAPPLAAQSTCYGFYGLDNLYAPLGCISDWIGENIVLPWVGEERLLEGGRFGTGLLDDLMIAGLLATEIVGYVDPTGVADVLNAGLNAADGNYADALLSLGGALIPGGGDKAGRAAGKVGSRAMDGFSSAAKSLSRHTACDAPTSIGRAIGNVLGRCFVGDTLVVLDFAPDYGQPLLASAASSSVEAAASDLLGRENLLLAAGVTAIVVGSGGAVLMERRRRKQDRQRSVEAVFAEDDLSNLIPNASDSLPEISRPEFDKLCDRLFAHDNESWLTHEVDDDAAQPDVPQSTERLPRVASKPVANGSSSAVKRQKEGKQPTMTAIADHKPSHPRTSRTGNSARAWRSSLLWLLPWLTLGVGCIGFALLGRSDLSSPNVPIVSATAHQSVAASADTTHLSSQSLPAQQTGKYLTCAIRDLPVVTWILAENPETNGNLGLDYSLLDPAGLRILKVRMVKPDGSLLHIQTLQSLLEMEDSKATQGSYIDLDYPELGISGQGEILEIQPCPRIPPRPSAKHCLVTTKFEHEAATVVDLQIDGLSESIGVTTNHPFWSEDLQEFVAAGDLRVRERLLTIADTTTRLAAITPRPGRYTVYNLEVDGEHVYYVSNSGLLVHNACTKELRRALNQPVGGGDAHHIIAAGSTNIDALRARDYLARTGISTESTWNGVMLNRSIHKGIHTNNYYTNVANAIEKAYGVAGPSQREKAEAIIQALDVLRDRLRRGDSTLWN
jgi:hypothetical protein